MPSSRCLAMVLPMAVHRLDLSTVAPGLAESFLYSAQPPELCSRSPELAAPFPASARPSPSKPREPTLVSVSAAGIHLQPAAGLRSLSRRQTQPLELGSRSWLLLVSRPA